MLEGFRQTFWSKGIKFLDYIKSNGSAYVDTGFVVSDYLTEIHVTASQTGVSTWSDILVHAGNSKAINVGDLKPGFGFCSISPFNDRQLYLRCGQSRWWNSAANAGNWSDGNMHNIRIGMQSTSSAYSYLDETSISMTREGNHTDITLPADSQTIFASKYDNQYYMMSSAYKVRRVAYSLNSNMLADFRAAKVYSQYGFYDVVSDVFHPAEGGSVEAGGEIDANA